MGVIKLRKRKRKLMREGKKKEKKYCLLLESLICMLCLKPYMTFWLLHTVSPAITCKHTHPALLIHAEISPAFFFFFFVTENTLVWVKSSPSLEAMGYYFRTLSTYWFFRDDCYVPETVEPYRLTFFFVVNRMTEWQKNKQTITLSTRLKEIFNVPSYF